MAIETRLRLFGIVIGTMVAASSLWIVACGDAKSGVLSGGSDTLKATLEGHIVPERDSFTVVLSRGDSGIKTVSHEGYFQFKGIDYGLYVLDVSGKGYGGYRKLISIDKPVNTLGRIPMESVPWPISLVSPSDTMVLRSGTTAFIRFLFSRNMERGTVERAITVSPSVPYRLEWTGSDFQELGEDLEILFDWNDLPAGVVHTVTLDTTARTLQGSPLESRVVRWVVNRPSTATQPFVSIGSTQLRFRCGPLDRIPITFAKPMDAATVAGRIVLSPSQGYRVEWSASGTTAYLYPATRWLPKSDLEVRLNGGYKALDGAQGVDVDESFPIDGFKVLNPDQGGIIDLAEELKMGFNLPVDISKLKYRATGASVVSVLPGGIDKVLWTFTGGTPGTAFTFELQSAVSIYGDTLSPGPAFLLRPLGKPATFRFYDSAQATAGFRPQGDRIRLVASWSAYSRIKDSLLQLSPAFPFTARWDAAAYEYGFLELTFPQPIPSGMRFSLSPAKGALPGDTLAFKTQVLSARPVHPFEGEALVRADEAIVLDWNTSIDTVGFAGRVSIEPPSGSLGIAQDTLGGHTRTVIRHADFAKATDYVIKVGGVQDLFGKAMADSLTLHFRTRP